MAADSKEQQFVMEFQSKYLSFPPSFAFKKNTSLFLFNSKAVEKLLFFLVLRNIWPGIPST